MSEQTEAVSPKVEPLFIEKDNPFVATELKRAGADLKGATYPALDKKYVLEQFSIIEKTLQDNGVDVPLLHLISLDAIARQTYSKQKQTFQEIWKDTETVEGDWNSGSLEEFRKIVVEGRAVTQGETKAELVDEREETLAELTAPETLTNPTRMQELVTKVRELNEAIAAKSRERKPKAVVAEAPVNA